MKKTLSRTFAVLMSAMILALPAFATQLRPCLDPVVPAEAETTEIQPRGPVCEYCGGNMVVTGKSDLGWKNIEYVSCTCEGALPQGQDVIKEHTVITTYKCSACGLGDTMTFTERVRQHYRN